MWGNWFPHAKVFISSVMQTTLLEKINYPTDLRHLSDLELKKLAIELRNETIRAVSETGGHLGSSLGVVELTVAIHSVFNTPHDKLIWDVGHQCYPHKIITGRREKMNSLRQEGGLSGFTKRSESCLLYTSPSPRDAHESRMPSSA